MQTLVRFFYRYHAFLLFLLLQFICIGLLYRYNPYQRSGILNTSNVITGGILEGWSNVTAYFSLNAANDQLSEENAELYNQLRDVTLVQVNAGLIMIEDTVYEQQYEFISGRVIGSTTNKGNNYLTLNIGRSDGVEVEMGVTGPKGIVGFVKTVSEHYCTVVSVLNEDFTASARMEDSNFFGQLKWDRESTRTASLQGVPVHGNVKVGDKVVTQSGTGRFPENLPIGTVIAVDAPQGEHNLDIQLELGTDFASVYHVYVIRNIHKLELEQLVEEIMEDAE